MFNQRGPFPPLCHPPEPPLPCCHVSPIHLPSLVRVVPFPSHRPLTACHMSCSFPCQPPIKACPLYLIPCSHHLLPCHVSSPAASLTPHCFLFPPHGFGATTPLLRPTLRAGLHAIHRAVQLIQVAARGAFHVIKVPSWPGCPQSQ
jgi:hypothetical protein